MKYIGIRKDFLRTKGGDLGNFYSGIQLAENKLFMAPCVQRNRAQTHSPIFTDDTRFYFGEAHSTALRIILRIIGSKKTGLVSWPGWK